MFLIDDVLLAPGKAALLLAQELARKAQEEWLNDDTVKQELQQLYQMLEAGRISDQEFEARECRLLERLEQIARLKYQDKWGGAPPPAAAPMVESGAVVSPLEAPMFVQPAFEPSIPSPPPALPPSSLALPPALSLPLPPPFSAPAPAMPAPVAGMPLTIGQVMECAVRALSMLRMRVSTITSVVPESSNWKVSVELVERRGIPDTNDVLGLYELWLDPSGNVLRYERTQMRRRCDFAR